jgi:hypothetical protein
MAHHRCIPLDSPVEWEKALDGLNHAFAHTWGHCYAMYLTTGFNTYLYCFELNNVRIVCPIAEREYNGYMDIVKPFGISGFVGNGDCPEFQYHWKEFARKKGYVCGYLGLNPVFDYSSHFDPEEVYQYDTVHTLDLTMDIDELFINLDSNRQRKLKKWSVISANLVYERSILEKFFLENYTDFLRAKNAAAFYFFSKESLLFLLSLENVMLVGARDLGKVDAVTLFAYTDGIADYLFNISLPEGRHHSTALIWHGVNYLKSKKIQILNLGGGGEGIAEYKKRFGSKTLPLRCLKQIYDMKIYVKLCRQVGADPADMTGYFPAYRKP